MQGCAVFLVPGTTHSPGTAREPGTVQDFLCCKAATRFVGEAIFEDVYSQAPFISLGLCQYITGITISDRLVAKCFGCLLSCERAKGKNSHWFQQAAGKKAEICFETRLRGSTGATRHHVRTNVVTSGLFPFGLRKVTAIFHGHPFLKRIWHLRAALKNGETPAERGHKYAASRGTANHQSYLRE